MKLDLSTARQQVIEMPPEHALSAAEKQRVFADIAALLREKNAVVIAHYYVEDALQELAEATGGFIGDSLEMARFGRDNPASTLIVCGVHFMGETAKILSPHKQVLVPDLQATCSLDISCPPQTFSEFCDAHPDRTVVVYANTSAAVKARADWVVTSSIAVPLIEHLHEKGEKILWAPDKHLGHYLQTKTKADILLWEGACIVHEAFKAEALCQLKHQYPEAAVLVHPEAPADVLALADVIGSTSQLLKASQQLPNNTCIIGTESGIFYKMRQLSPHKRFIQAPTGGHGATCQSCAHCPWMKMNSLEKLYEVLKTGSNEIVLAPDLVKKAQVSLERMLGFVKEHLSTSDTIWAVKKDS